MLHDLLRDLAIHQSKGESFEQRKRLIIDLNGNNWPGWWVGPNQQGIISHRYSFITGMLVNQKQLKVAARILCISTGMFLCLNYITWYVSMSKLTPFDTKIMVLTLKRLCQKWFHNVYKLI